MHLDTLWSTFNAAESSGADAVPEECYDPTHFLDVLGKRQSATAKIRSNELVCSTTSCGAPVHDNAYAASDNHAILRQSAHC